MQPELNVQINNSVEAIGKPAWDRLSAGIPYASYDWYCFGETVLRDSQPFYITVFHQGDAVARAAFWLERNQPLPKDIQAIRGLVGGFLRARPLLICRSPLSDTSGLILPEPPLRGPAFQAILAAVRDLGRQYNASFQVFDYLTPAQANWPDWPPGFTPYSLSDSGLCLPIQWNSMEGYLKELSKNRLKDFRSKRKHAAQMGLKFDCASHVDDIDEALSLIQNVSSRHNSLPRPWARAILENASLIPSAWITARLEGKLVGCGILMRDGETFTATLLGLDYSCKDIYLQVMYTAIETAIEQGAKLLRMGSGAVEFKHSLGFQLENNNYLRFAGQNRLFNWLGRLAAGGAG